MYFRACPFDEPFQDVNQYGAALLDGLVAQYAVVREELAEEGIAAEWALSRGDTLLAVGDRPTPTWSGWPSSGGRR